MASSHRRDFLYGEEFKQLPLGNTGFEGNPTHFLAEIEDAIHAAEIDDDAAIGDGHTGAVAPVLAGTDGIDGDGEPPRDREASL